MMNFSNEVAEQTNLPTFHCSSCEEIVSGTAIDVASYETCKECFETGNRPQFEAAMIDEESYPPRVGSVKLDITDYTALFSSDFITAYLEKAKQFDIMPRSRVYCAREDCAAFLGQARASQALQECNLCHSSTCMKCRTLVKVDGEGGHNEVALLDHPCPSFCHPEDSKHHMLPEETRSKEWQMCPGDDCGTLVVLQDGCNHVTCGVPACGTQFCYICGTPQKDDGSGHWRYPNPCPRYGTQPSEAPRPVEQLDQVTAAWGNLTLDLQHVVDRVNDFNFARALEAANRREVAALHRDMQRNAEAIRQHVAEIFDEQMMGGMHEAHNLLNHRLSNQAPLRGGVVAFRADHLGNLVEAFPTTDDQQPETEEGEMEVRGVQFPRPPGGRPEEQ